MIPKSYKCPIIQKIAILFPLFAFLLSVPFPSWPRPASERAGIAPFRIEIAEDTVDRSTYARIEAYNLTGALQRVLKVLERAPIGARCWKRLA